jgi:uncharacterized membrane protein YgdD (TMEM256/DUF423 family)
MNFRNTLLSAGVLGLLSVALGAFGAHALKPVLTELNRVDTFELAVRYQMYHALALLATGLAGGHTSQRYLRKASVCFVAGITLFSGSLYALCFISLKSLALLTPLGGLFLLAGWTLLIIAILKTEKPSV